MSAEHFVQYPSEHVVQWMVTSAAEQAVHRTLRVRQEGGRLDGSSHTLSPLSTLV